MSSAIAPRPWVVRVSHISFRMLLILSMPSRTIRVGSSSELLWTARKRSACGGPSGRGIFIASTLMLGWRSCRLCIRSPREPMSAPKIAFGWRLGGADGFGLNRSESTKVGPRHPVALGPQQNRRAHAPGRAVVRVWGSQSMNLGTRTLSFWTWAIGSG